MKIAVKKVPPNVAKDVRAIDKGDKKLDHPYYVVEKRKGTGKATCRQCDKTIDEGDPTLYFHYAPEEDNTWIRTRGTIHADDCEGGKDEWTKCPKCRKQIPRADWSSHWAKEKGKRAANKTVTSGTPMADWHMMEPDEDEKRFTIRPKEFPVEQPIQVPVKEPVKEPEKVPVRTGQAEDDEFPGEITDEGKIVGYKYFKLKHKDGNWLFASPAQHGTPLWPKGAVTAVCGNNQDHTAPGPKSCNCGIHMCHSEDSSTLEGYKKGAWLARLEAWGEEDEHGNGGVTTGSLAPDVIRAQHVQVVGIRPPACDQCDKPSTHMMSIHGNASSGIPMCEDHLPEVLEGGDKPHAIPMHEIANKVSEYYGGLAVRNVGEPWEENPLKGEQFKSSRIVSIKKAHCGQCDEDYDDERLHKHKKNKGTYEQIENALIDRNPANNVGPYKRSVRMRCPECETPLNTSLPGHAVCPKCGWSDGHPKQSAQGLDPTAEPGNQTSMGDDPKKIKPRVDPYTQDKMEQTQKMQLDQEARKLQRGMKSLDQFAGSWKLVIDPRWKRVSSIEMIAAHDREWWKYRSPYMRCPSCDGQKTPQDCYSCQGSGIVKTPTEGKSPIPNCRCTSCTGDRTDKAGYDMWGREVGGYIKGLSPWSGVFKGGVPPKVYPDHTTPCGQCKGTGGGWRGEPKGCYRCGGSGAVAEPDPRDKLEDILERHSKSPSKKYIVGIDNNTGLHEDEEHYNIKFHNTDILSFHKTKPEVTIDTGGWYHPTSGNRMEGITTKHRMNDYLPQNISVEVGEVAPRESALLVTTHAGAYKLRDGQTYDMKTGLNVSSGIDPEYQKCKECHRYRDAEEMPKHQKRHEQYRARMDRQKAEYLNGPPEPEQEPLTNLPGQTKIPV